MGNRYIGKHSDPNNHHQKHDDGLPTDGAAQDETLSSLLEWIGLQERNAKSPHPI